MRWITLMVLFACGWTASAQSDTIYLDSSAIGQYIVDEKQLDCEIEIQNIKEINSAFVFPKRAKVAGIAGKIVFRVLVDTVGKIAAYQLLRSPHQWLTSAYLELLPKIKYNPPMQYGVRVYALVILIFNPKSE